MSIRSTERHFDKKKVARFHRLDNQHISAIESLYKGFPFLKDRMEIHMPFSRAKSTFSRERLWVWPKFDKRPAGYLVFIDGFAPCIWWPERQEGMTFRWVLPPGFHESGVTICLANLLSGESLVQIEDLLVYKGRDLWSTAVYSKRWEALQEFWQSLPPEQPLMECKVQLVQPISLDAWDLQYNAQIYWIIQPDHCRQARWYWKDTVTPHHKVEFHAPTMKRSPMVVPILCARCAPSKSVLPDNYTLFSQEDTVIGTASITTLALSMILREKACDGIPVEVQWNERFQKYQILRLMPTDTPITNGSFFCYK
jgi:hypothetical protein